jgi:hypothetical protein
MKQVASTNIVDPEDMRENVIILEIRWQYLILLVASQWKCDDCIGCL